MRLFLIVVTSLVIILTIYRRIIEPFREGLRGNVKPHNRVWMSSGKKQKKKIELDNIEEADYTEIK